MRTLLLVAALTVVLRVAWTVGTEPDRAMFPVHVDGWADIAQSLAAGHGYAVLHADTGVPRPTALRSRRETPRRSPSALQRASRARSTR